MKPLHVVLIVLALSPVGLYALQSRPAAPARPSSSIAFLSVQKILTESNPAKAANRELEELRRAKAEDVGARKKALDDTRLAIANAGGMFSSSRRAELKSTEQRQEADLKQATEDAQKAFVERQRELQAELRTDLGRILNDLGRERTYQYVLNADTSLVWARDATDLTGEILERLNQLPASKPATK